MGRKESRFTFDGTKKKNAGRKRRKSRTNKELRTSVGIRYVRSRKSAKPRNGFPRNFLILLKDFKMIEIKDFYFLKFMNFFI